ncbi:MAG: glycosyltransferase family 2 protein [Lachnospiraceae bacterium]|nr:glycosyltransferase family 2 protein [Lachnospiraceae bacterium]
MKDLISIVVPCFNEEESLPLFMDAIGPVRTALSGAGSDLSAGGDPAGSLDTAQSASCICDTELIFIDDGSSDGTLELLKAYRESDPSVRYISFSRNFGKEAGIYAGLNAARGNYVVLLDADLQHPVEFIPRMYQILSGKLIPDESSMPTASAACDSVAMCRQSRKGHERIRSFFSKGFFRVMNRLSKINLVDGATDYRMMTRKMVDAVLSMREYNRFTKGIFNWVGFKTLWMPYDDVPRKAGRSKWSFAGLLRYSLEGMFAFSTVPLTISFSLGLIFCLIALVFAVYVAVKTMIWGDPVAGFPTLFCMMLFFGGIQLFFLGVIGQYLSKMYLEVKHRPLYIIKEESD